MTDGRSSRAGGPNPEPYRVLAVDDQPEVLSSLRRLLRRRGFDVTGMATADEALAALEADPLGFDLVLLDINMPGTTGLEILPRARSTAPEVQVVMLTADDSASSAVAAMRAGAFTYLTKPLPDADTLALTLERAGQYGLLERRARKLERHVDVAERFETLVGSSRPMRELYATLSRLAATDANVLITGESGTGKELAARAIHNRSARASAPFVALNCGAIPEQLIDSELFGHTKGAFTGAQSARSGVFVESHGGTLFLDEIGDIPAAVQLRLLRVLQEREVRAVGGTGSRSVDVRVISATNIDLDTAVEKREFRADLFYRLNVIALDMPPLRERLDDVPLLATHLLKKHARHQSRAEPRFTARAVEALASYRWPGNVRELENAIQRALAMMTADGEEIDVDALPRTIVEAAGTAAGRGGRATGRLAARSGGAHETAGPEARLGPDELGPDEREPPAVIAESAPEAPESPAPGSPAPESADGEPAAFEAEGTPARGGENGARAGAEEPGAAPVAGEEPQPTTRAEGAPAAAAGATPAAWGAGACGAGDSNCPLTLVDFDRPIPYAEAAKRARSAFERAYLRSLLAHARGNVSEAARLAGMDRSNLRRILSRHGIDPRRYREAPANAPPDPAGAKEPS